MKDNLERDDPCDDLGHMIMHETIMHDLKSAFNNIDDPKINSSLRAVLPRFDDLLDNLEVITFEAAYETVEDHLGFNIGLLHRKDERRLCFEAALTLLYHYRNESEMLKIRFMEGFLTKYPEFNDVVVDSCERNVLMKYRNMMKVVLRFQPPRNHKAHIMDLVTRLTEGLSTQYVTGSGEKPATRRRVLIFERETQIRPLCRPQPTGKSLGASIKAEPGLSTQLRVEPHTGVPPPKVARIVPYAEASLSLRRTLSETDADKISPVRPLVMKRSYSDFGTASTAASAIIPVRTIHNSDHSGASSPHIAVEIPKPPMIIPRLGERGLPDATAATTEPVLGELPEERKRFCSLVLMSHGRVLSSPMRRRPCGGCV
jgi:hypothetical protein